jgi:hypothetical protein
MNVSGIRDQASDRLALVAEYLSDESLGPWLLVLDGTDNLEIPDVLRVRACIPSSPVGAVLVTTSNRKIAGKLEERAEDKYKEALKTTASSLGEGHPEVSRVMCHLATLYGIQGRRPEAQQLFQKTITLQRERPGPQHLDTLMTMHNYAVFVQGGNDENGVKSASEMLGHVLEQQDRVLGEDHIDTLRTASNLASGLWWSDKDEEASKLCKVVLSKQVETLGDKHPDTVATKKLMARIDGRGE